MILGTPGKARKGLGRTAENLHGAQLKENGHVTVTHGAQWA